MESKSANKLLMISVEQNLQMKKKIYKCTSYSIDLWIFFKFPIKRFLFVGNFLEKKCALHKISVRNATPHSLTFLILNIFWLLYYSYQFHFLRFILSILACLHNSLMYLIIWALDLSVFGGWPVCKTYIHTKQLQNRRTNEEYVLSNWVCVEETKMAMKTSSMNVLTVHTLCKIAKMMKFIWKRVALMRKIINFHTT